MRAVAAGDAHAGRLEAAVKVYRHVLAHDAGQAKAWHNLGVVLTQQAEAAFLQSQAHAGADAALRRGGADMAHRLAAALHPQSGSAAKTSADTSTNPSP